MRVDAIKCYKWNEHVINVNLSVVANESLAVMFSSLAANALRKDYSSHYVLGLRNGA